MIGSAILSALHVLALAIGLGAVFARGRRLRELRASTGGTDTLTRLFHADTLWGVAAGLWATTGLLRAFGRMEKSPEFYVSNVFFWVKMALFTIVLALEVFPMVTFVRWRLARSRGPVPVAASNLGLLIALNDVELAIVVLIPFVAALMARGAWLF